MINILRRKEGIAKSSGKASMADRELMLRQVLDRKIEDVCVRLDVPRTAVHFIENYHSGVLNLEQEVRNISVDFHALKILSQCCSHADAFIAQALQDLRMEMMLLKQTEQKKTVMRRSVSRGKWPLSLASLERGTVAL
eukprot:g19865.t1